LSSILHSTHWFNFPETKSLDETLNNLFIVSTLKQTSVSHLPVIINMWNGKINILDSFNHSENERQYLNNTGLYIFLYEPLCQYVEGFPHNRGFHSEVKFEQDINLMRADELDSIKKYVIKNNLTNVHVYTCDYNSHIYFPYYNKYFKIACDDLFIKNYVVFEASNNKKIDKNFICLNWRHSKHRHLLAAFLAQENSFISWYFRSTLDILLADMWADISKWQFTNIELYNQLVTGLNTLNTTSPRLLDIEQANLVDIIDPNIAYYPESVKYANHHNPAMDNSRNSLLESFYDRSFCDVVNETRFAQHTGNFSEKLFQSVRYKTPFILVAPPRTLEYAQNYGFKTFENFWDEGYDRCDNHEQRLIKIFQLIKFIGSLSLNDCKNLYKDMEPILEHNYNILVEKTYSKQTQKYK